MAPKSEAISTKVPDEFFENLPFWDDLTKDRQRTVIQATNRINAGMVGVIKLRAEVARAAAEAREALGGTGYWHEYVKRFAQSWSSAYRWLGRLDKLALPPAVLDRAAERGIDVVDGRYFKAMKELPAPKATEGKALDSYFDKVMVTVRDRRSKAKREGKDPQRAERDAWRAVVNQGRHVTAGRSRTAWVLRLIGKLMAEFAIPEQRMAPEAVPEEFRPAVGYPKGRPRKVLSS